MTRRKQDLRQSRQKTAPTWHFEAQTGGKHVAGVDEAGRGPLAGPVVAAAVILNTANIPDGLNDSKKLSGRKREALFEMIFDSSHVGIGMAEPAEIDRINILNATMVAMQRAVANLPVKPDALLIDGNRCPESDVPAQAIVKGDARSLSIAAASIIAKTARDRLMQQADKRFPNYGFAGHKGYPTKAHRETLQNMHACPIHRRSYGPVRLTIDKAE